MSPLISAEKEAVETAKARNIIHIFYNSCLNCTLKMYPIITTGLTVTSNSNRFLIFIFLIFIFLILMFMKKLIVIYPL